MPRRATVTVVAAAVGLAAVGCSSGGSAQAVPSGAGTSSTAPAPASAAPSSSAEVRSTSSAVAASAVAAPTTTTTTPPVFTPQRVAPRSVAGASIAAGVDRTNPAAVATAVLTAFFTADTTVDAGPNDAAARASALLSPSYAATILASPPVIGAGAQWDGWSARGVRLSAEVTPLPDDRPADTATTAFRIDLVTQTPTTAAGQALLPVVVVAYVALQSTPAGWAVATIDQR